MRKQKIFQNAGFSLIELIVTIAIITMMTGIFFVDYRTSGRASELKIAANKLAGDIRIAQNNTLGALEFGGTVPLGGWGVYFDEQNANDEYRIFADVNNNHKYAVGENYKTISLPDDVIILDLETDGAGNRRQVHITFEPPKPNAWITFRNNNINRDKAIIILQNEKTLQTIDIEVNFYGLIDVN